MICHKKVGLIIFTLNVVYILASFWGMLARKQNENLCKANWRKQPVLADRVLPLLIISLFLYALFIGTTGLSKQAIQRSYLFERAFQAVRERNPDLGYKLTHANKLYFHRNLPLNSCIQLLLQVSTSRHVYLCINASIFSPIIEELGYYSSKYRL